MPVYGDPSAFRYTVYFPGYYTLASAYYACKATMATGMVKAAISTILQDKDFDQKTIRMTLARESAQKMLDAISGNNFRGICVH